MVVIGSKTEVTRWCGSLLQYSGAHCVNRLAYLIIQPATFGSFRPQLQGQSPRHELLHRHTGLKVLPWRPSMPNNWDACGRRQRKWRAQLLLCDELIGPDVKQLNCCGRS
jgi:hypothetical protein